MIRYINILIFIFLFVNCSDEKIKINGKDFKVIKPLFNDSVFYEVYFPNGLLEEQFGLSEDTLGNGFHKIFYPNQRLRQINHFRHGELDGICKSFTSKGIISHIKNYKNGLKNGFHYVYNESGELHFINYNFNGKNFYIKDARNEMEQFSPLIELEIKNYSNSLDTLIVKYRLPLPDSLIRDKDLYFFSSIKDSISNPGEFVMPNDSFPLDNNRLKAVSFSLNAQSKFNLSFSYIGKRSKGKYENYGIVKKKF